jgi:hypothetical protein
MRSAIIAALVAALVAGGTAGAASYINGRSIRPHSIPLNRLAHRPAGLPGPVGPKGDVGCVVRKQGVFYRRGVAFCPVGPAGPQGEQGAGGAPGPQGMSIFAYPNPEEPGRCVDIYQEVHQYTDLQVLVDTICAPEVKP